MDRPTTAEEALTLLTELPRLERVRLVRLIVAEAGNNDAMAYEAMPVGPDEFLYNKDAMAWDAEGWEEYYRIGARFGGAISGPQTRNVPY